MLLLTAALAPVAFMMHFVYARDKYEREPAGRIVLVYVLGMLTVIPAAIFETVFALPASLGLAGIAVTVWLVIALAEELVKYWVLRVVAMPHPSFNEVYDGILYGVAASLGFATTENVLYIFSHETGGLGTAALRALLSIPGHALWGVMMGYYAGRSKFEPVAWKRKFWLFRGLLLAVFMHGLYDFFAFGADAAPSNLQLLFALAVPGVVVLSWIVGLALVRRAQAESVFKRPAPMINPIAALSPMVKYCHNCGLKLPRDAVSCVRCGYRFP